MGTSWSACRRGPRGAHLTTREEDAHLGRESGAEMRCVTRHCARVRLSAVCSRESGGGDHQTPDSRG